MCDILNIIDGPPSTKQWRWKNCVVYLTLMMTYSFTLPWIWMTFHKTLERKESLGWIELETQIYHLPF